MALTQFYGLGLLDANRSLRYVCIWLCFTCKVTSVQADKIDVACYP